jgi:hypothetical protein
MNKAANSDEVDSFAMVSRALLCAHQAAERPDLHTAMGVGGWQETMKLKTPVAVPRPARVRLEADRQLDPDA